MVVTGVHLGMSTWEGCLILGLACLHVVVPVAMFCLSLPLSWKTLFTYAVDKQVDTLVTHLSR